ncbi:hypothetical protein KSP35_01445 [Aquihabitans sp. G128]|uniref:hypothetical protein n=1 Tax=Aquihabitans sp. G128 TaxID=2849779 RepID=UPI001C23BBE6|nr:hypothetical protein [Aquihabitans sp. G128]QXC61542.1 hypothetical protein KSP35_01445 [Aquihabitans sp. G128]
MSAVAPLAVDRARPPGLTRVLVRLKLRLVVNRARSTRNGSFGLAMSVLFGVAAAGAGLLFGLVAGPTLEPHDRDAILVLAPNLLVLAWAVLPLATFGNDETLDPGRLVLFPLRRGPLLRGLLAASFVGPVPVAAVTTTVGVAIGFGGASGVLVALPAGALALVMAVAASRALSTTLAAALSSRRSRDAAIVIGSLIAVSFQFLRFVRLPSVSASVLDHIVAVARWTPPGLLGRSVVEARGGHWLVALAALVPALVVVPLLLLWWGRALDRALTVVVSGSTPSRRRRDAAAAAAAAGPAGPAPGGSPPRPALALLPAWLPFVPASPVGAVAARDLRYSWRDPRRKSALLVRTLLAVGGPIWLLVQAGDPPPEVVLLAAGVAYVAVLGSFNQFGLDGGALWSDLASGDRLRTLLVGKNLSALLQVVPAVAVSSAVLAVATGGWVYVPAALLLGAGAVGVGLGVADVVSIKVPFKVPESRGPFGGGAFGAGGGGQGFVTGLTLFAASLVQNLVLAPIAVASGLAVAFAPAALLVVAPVGAAYGYGIWRAGLGMAVRQGWWREPELLAAVDPARSG